MGRRLLLAGTVTAMLLVGAACSDDDGGSADEDATTTEAETTTTPEEISGDAVQERMDLAHPVEASLVDWSTFRLDPDAGYTATVPEGTPADQAVVVCNGIAEVLDTNESEEAIQVVAGPGEVALAGRASPDADCAAA